MTPNDTLEITAATVELAVKEALAQLGARESEVEVEILSTPRTGLLGLGARQARVRVSRRSAAPAVHHGGKAAPATAPRKPAGDEDESEDAGSDGPPRVNLALQEQAAEAIELLTRIMELMGEKAEVVLAASDPEGIEIELKGDGSGLLIGRHGQTLDALEYLVNRLIARKVKDAAPVVIDTESYRARRRQQLERIALSMGERAKREHKSISLDPMPPRDRRIIHLALKDDPLLQTRSSGGGYLRSLEIAPVEGSRERGGRTPRPRERDPVGEQGGFKHGQKRIV